MSLKEHVDIVFSTLFPDNLEAFRHAQLLLTPDHFEDKHARTLWVLLEKYSQRFGGIASPEWLREKFKSSATKSSRNDFIKLASMVEEYEGASQRSLAAFKGSVDILHEEYIKTKTGRAIAEAFEILEHGLDVDGEELIGHETAREYLGVKLRDVEAEYHRGEVSEGDVGEDNDFMADYLEVKANLEAGNAGGIGFGISSLDRWIGGVMPGDLVVVGGFAGSGKTQVLSQMAWNAMVNQKKNVFFSTTETVRRQVHCRILSRHSRLPKFGVPGGLNSKDLIKGTLSHEHEAVLKNVLDDMLTGDYGSVLISQNPSEATLDFVESRIVGWEQHTGKKADLVLLDSLYLLRPTRKYSSQREELTYLLQDAKRRATALEVPIVTPWQINRQSYEKAIDGSSGFGYNLASFADTSETERSASILLALLRLEEERDVAHLQVLKNRDGEEMRDMVVQTDFRNAYLSDPSDADDLFIGSGVIGAENLINAF